MSPASSQLKSSRENVPSSRWLHALEATAPPIPFWCYRVVAGAAELGGWLRDGGLATARWCLIASLFFLENLLVSGYFSTEGRTNTQIQNGRAEIPQAAIPTTSLPRSVPFLIASLATADSVTLSYSCAADEYDGRAH